MKHGDDDKNTLTIADIKPGDIVQYASGDFKELGIYIGYMQYHGGYWAHRIWWTHDAQETNEEAKTLLAYRQNWLFEVKDSYENP